MPDTQVQIDDSQLRAFLKGFSNPRLTAEGIIEGVRIGMIPVYNRILENLSGRILKVRTGALRRSVYPRPGTAKPRIEGSDVVVEYGADSTAPYACIFDSDTKVRTERGSLQIGCVRVGDKVLTQDGNFHEVLAISKFKAQFKPDLVEIIIPWRQNKNHKLTVTSDHKVLTRIDGVNKWIEAGMLTADMELWTPIKLVHNKNIKRFPLLRCSYCGNQYYKTGNNRKISHYCSDDCKFKGWELNHPHRGMKRSEEAKQKMSIAAQKRMVTINQLAALTHPTSTEIQIKHWLDVLGISYNQQVQIGRYIIDFEIPDSHILIEADGAFWHQEQDIDIERDKEILQHRPDWKIIHYHFAKERYSNNINPNPLPNVYYVICNPGTKTLVDPTKFKPTKILSLRKFNLNKSHINTQKRALLYDLTVQDVHSFVANGIVVSNSVHEFGGIIVPKRAKYLAFQIENRWVFTTRVVIPERKPFRAGAETALPELRAYIALSVLKKYRDAGR